ncbi:MAG: aminodeoxychorismate lyase [Methylococcaceae bacterium]|nr:aminodeoxychorismate lyase [Methylococcaceae bacterium]
MYLLNGESRQCIDVADRGFQYGDGLFETIEVSNGKPLFLERHLARLSNGCRRLLIPVPDLALLTQEALQVSAASERAVLKLIVTRGCGGRGYRQPPRILPTRLFSLHPFPDYPEHFQAEGITVRFCRLRLANSPALAGIKHMNRLEQVLARAEWWDDGIQEGLMLDSNEHVVEGTMTNLFMVKDGVLYTPIVTECGVAGIVREMVMEFAQCNNITLIETQLDKDTLLRADEVFVTNSVIGIWPVMQIEQHGFGVGPLTRSFQAYFNAARAMETGQ